MHPPFTTEQFLDVFRRYNETVWPAQFVLLAVGAVVVVAACRANLHRSWRWAQVSLATLAALWLWTGIVYHKLFFATLSPMGEVFGSLCMAQAVILLICTWQGAWQFTPASRGSVVAGSLIVAYSLLFYPAIGVLLGHGYPSSPSFGTPCPITLFTLGIFCLLPASIPRLAMVVPVLWAVIGSYASLGFGMREDMGLLVAAVTATAVIHHETHGRRIPRPAV